MHWVPSIVDDLERGVKLSIAEKTLLYVWSICEMEWEEVLTFDLGRLTETSSEKKMPKRGCHSTEPAWTIMHYTYMYHCYVSQQVKCSTKQFTPFTSMLQPTNRQTDGKTHRQTVIWQNSVGQYTPQLLYCTVWTDNAFKAHGIPYETAWYTCTWWTNWMTWCLCLIGTI